MNLNEDQSEAIVKVFRGINEQKDEIKELNRVITEMFNGLVDTLSQGEPKEVVKRNKKLIKQVYRLWNVKQKNGEDELSQVVEIMKKLEE